MWSYDTRSYGGKEGLESCESHVWLLSLYLTRSLMPANLSDTTSIHLSLHFFSYALQFRSLCVTQKPQQFSVCHDKMPQKEGSAWLILGLFLVPSNSIMFVRRNCHFKCSNKSHELACVIGLLRTNRKSVKLSANYCQQKNCPFHCYHASIKGKMLGHCRSNKTHLPAIIGRPTGRPREL